MPKGKFERTDEHRQHIADALRGKPKDPEHVRKMAEAKRGFQHSEESKKKMADSRLGKKHAHGWTEEQRAALSEARKGFSTGLIKLGFSPEKQRSERAAGNKWCYLHKAFLSAKTFVGTRNYCKECGPLHNRNTLLRATFGVDSEWYERKLAEQGGGCAICGNSKPRVDHKFLPIDHNHKTGALRGILCNRCNAFIGMLEAGLLDKALAYLARYA